MSQPQRGTTKIDLVILKHCGCPAQSIKVFDGEKPGFPEICKKPPRQSQIEERRRTRQGQRDGFKKQGFMKDFILGRLNIQLDCSRVVAFLRESKSVIDLT